MSRTKKPENQIQTVTIKAPEFRIAEFRIEGDAPYVQHRFGHKAKIKMLETQIKEGAKRKDRKPRNIDEEYLQSMYEGEDGGRGIPAAAFRSSMIDACRMCGFKMTEAKMSIFVKADTFDKHDGTPLVLIEGEPHKVEHTVRLAKGVASVAVRAMWTQWSANLKLQYDADQFSDADVANLLARGGMQVGVGEGRPFSKNSHGMGWGTFRIAK